jgi:hypothetical protein
MVARAARLVGLDTTLSDIAVQNILAQFGDHRTIATWAQEAIAFCYRENILVEEGFYIRPVEAISRAEIAEMLYRLLTIGQLL